MNHNINRDVHLDRLPDREDSCLKAYVSTFHFGKWFAGRVGLLLVSALLKENRRSWRVGAALERCEQLDWQRHCTIDPRR